MKSGLAFSVLTGIALLGSIAKFNEMPADAQWSLLRTAGTTRRMAPSLLSSAAAIYNEVTGSTAQRSEHVPVVEWGMEEGNAAPRRVAAQAEPSSGNPLWALPLTQLSATRERPIFSPSRRPPPPPMPTFVAPVAVLQPVKPPEPERPDVTLLGTIIGIGDDRMGVFLNTSTKGIVRLRVGEDHQGWVVRQIKPREATMVKDGRQGAVLELPAGGASSPPLRGRDAMLEAMRKVGAD